MEKNANQYKEMYDRMGISIDKLGCIMQDLDGSKIPNLFQEEDLYYTPNADRFWINGFVAGEKAHVTLLYGLLESGNTVYREYVDTVLAGWKCDSVEIDDVGYFDSPYPDEPYYCIIAHLRVTDALKEANQSLQLLPHINTFPDYKPHITIAYIRKDEYVRDKAIWNYDQFFGDFKLRTKEGINYGK